MGCLILITHTNQTSVCEYNQTSHWTYIFSNTVAQCCEIVITYYDVCIALADSWVQFVNYTAYRNPMLFLPVMYSCAMCTYIRGTLGIVHRSRVHNFTLTLDKYHHILHYQVSTTSIYSAIMTHPMLLWRMVATLFP